MEDQVALVEGAIDRGVWTEEDANAFRQLTFSMAHADRVKAMSSVSMAINNGKLKLETIQPF